MPLGGLWARLVTGAAVFFLATAALLASPPPRVIAFAQDTLANDWRAAQVEAVRQGLQGREDVRFVVTDARGSAALQVKQIEDLWLQGVDVLITSPLDQALLTPVIRRVHQQGLPVILLSRGVEGFGYTSFVHPDNRLIARQAARYLTEKLNGRGRVLMLEGLAGTSVTQHRTEQFLQEMQRHPQITVVRRVGNFLRADAVQAVETLLAAGERFDAIYAQSDSMASGARAALRRAGMDPADCLIVGIDYIHEARDAIRDGRQAASFTYPTGGEIGARLALQVLDGQPIPSEVVIDSQTVTRHNVELIEPIF